MEFREVVEKLINKPKYMTNGAGRLSKLFNCSKEDVYKAKNFIYCKIKSVGEPIKEMPKILILDIETSPMRSYTWGRWKQNVSLSQTISEWFILSWAAKWLYSPTTMSMSISPSDVKNENDKEICVGLWSLIDKADIIVAHNGNSFDIPKINSRFIVNNLQPTSPYQTIDTLLIAKKQFGFSSNKLDALAGYFGIEHKMETGFELWSKCMSGDAESLKYMEEYNRKDVEILEEVYLVMRPWIKNHPNVSLFNNLPVNKCASCGSSDVIEIPDKYYYTSIGAYQVYRCLECGSLSRGRKTVIEKSKNKTTLTNVSR